MVNLTIEETLQRVARRLGRTMVVRAGRKLVVRTLVVRVGTPLVERIQVAKGLAMVEAGVLILGERVGTLVARAGLPVVRAGSNAAL